ncbi:MAG: hypothetical protein OHK0029_37120 [Armatimonadaceae bacterium]
MSLPVGTVTFLFTDIQGSTRLWEQQPEAMSAALARHDDIMRQAIAAHNGVVFKTVGDAFCAAFDTAPDAIQAAVRAQRKLGQESWEVAPGLRVRMAFHTGAAEVRDQNYFGSALNRVARLLSIGHGGQVLLSQTTYDLARDHTFDRILLQSLGEHRLRDLARPEQVYQLSHPDLTTDFPPLRSLDHPDLPNNLPPQMTSFIGREQEMATVRGFLGRTRLLTLTGAGGVGKTRLAIQVAADLLERFPDGVWFVELARVADPALVIHAVAAALNLREEGGQPLTATVTDVLRNRRTLIILDNCEHLIEACAQIADLLLRSCPDVKILATSREPLNIAGEHTYRIPSLALPDPKSNLRQENLTQYEAVRLFIERAVQIRPDFTVTNQNAPALASLCTRLDGIPLALELAAARIRSLTVEEIESRLSDAFRLLTGGSRTALPRQQTLRAAIDWSFELLNPQEKVLLRRLSVFSGGWTMEAAEQVCAGGGDDVSLEDWEILDLLTGLADRSLVVREETPEGSRYRLLETVRQYAGEKLIASGEQEMVAESHLLWCLHFTGEASQKLVGAEQGIWMNRLETEHDNIRAALRRVLDEPGKEAEVFALVRSLRRFWGIRGYWSEGLSYLTAALALPDTGTAAIARAETQNTAGVLAMLLDNLEEAQTYLEASLHLARQENVQPLVASSLLNLGNLSRDQGKYEQALSFYEQGIEVNRQLGNRAGEANNLQMLGRAFSDLGRFTDARPPLEAALRMNRETGDRFSEAVVLDNLAALAVIALAALYGEVGDLPRAARLFGFETSLRQRIGYQFAPIEIAEYEAARANVQQALGNDHYTAEWQTGTAMTIDDAVRDATKSL